MNKITQAEIAMKIMRIHKKVIPAKLVGKQYYNWFIGSDFTRTCRQLRADGLFFSPPEREDNYTVFLPTKKLINKWKHGNKSKK